MKKVSSKISTQEAIANIYAPLVKRFVENIPQENVEGIQAPHMPIAGKNYDCARYKLAFVGMETKGWDSLGDFIQKAKTNPEYAVSQYNKWLKEDEIVKYTRPASFWHFILEFLSRFYAIDYKTLIRNDNDNSLLSSFLWGNANSIERYDVSAKKLGADYEIYNKVKEQSKEFDSINHIIQAANPRVVIILHKWVSDNYILQDDDVKTIANLSPKQKKVAFVENPDIECNYKYMYLREQHTHVFVLPHPRWINANGGNKKYINSIIEVMKSLKIWKKLPHDSEDWRLLKQPIPKYAYIAQVASFLVEHDMIMSGQQLSLLLNLNGIKKNDGKCYSEKGGVGIHRLISCAYAYYHDSRKDYLTALKIAKAFVKKNGCYAYK